MYGNCNCSTDSGRGFLTIKERIELLEEYKEQLDLESQGVSERIKALQKAGGEAN